MSPEIKVTTRNLLPTKSRWFDLDEFMDEEEFRAAAQAAFRRLGDPNPELVFLDSVDIPRILGVTPGDNDLHYNLWHGWVLLSEDDRNLYANFCAHCSPDLLSTLDDAKARLIGCYDSRDAYGQSVWQDRGWISDLPPHLHRYIDFGAWVRDAEASGEFITDLSLFDDDIWVWTAHS